MYSRFFSWILLVSSVIFVVYAVRAIYTDNIAPEWMEYQTRYKTLVMKRAPDEKTRELAKAFNVEIQQVYLEKLGRVDRCMSCHIGVDNKMVADVDQPIRTHPGDYLKHHPADKFGCTICHHGQGRALDMQNAHGSGRETHWDWPILPIEYMQSACSSCHDMGWLAMNGGERVARGEKIFRDRGCLGCHKMEGKGGVLGKKIDGVGSQPIAYFPMANVRGEKTVYAWMKQHFDDPRNIVPESEMIIDLTDEETILLTTYVLSLSNEDIPKGFRHVSDVVYPKESPKDPGEALYNLYCVSCHDSGQDSVYDEVFKRTIPAIQNVDFLGAVSDKYLLTLISEGRTGTPMTAWKEAAAGLKSDEINSIIKYVTRNRPTASPRPFEFAKFKGDAKRGKEIFSVRCVDCHGSRGEGGVGLNLRNPVVQQHANPEFLAITLRDGRVGTHMRAFGEQGVGLSDQDIVDVITHVKTLSED
jgi:mono/diheme cytochrome c family protein